MELEVRNVDVTLVNAVRRVVHSEIPSVAPHHNPYDASDNDIRIITNTSSLHDGILGDRLSLVPIHLTQPQIDTFHPGMFKFVIRKKNTTGDVMLVTSEDIEVFDGDGRALAKDVRDAMFPPDPITGGFILLNRLKPNHVDVSCGQEMHVVFVARKDCAKRHARWSVVSQCVHSYVVDEALAKKTRERLWKEAFSLREPSQREIEEFENMWQYGGRQRCYVRNEYDEPCAFVFRLESESALRPEAIFGQALTILHGKALGALVEDARDEDGGEEGIYTFALHGEGHTLGSLLQAHIYNTSVRHPLKKGRTCKYIGYRMPHPLQEEIILRVKPQGDGGREEARAILVNGLASLASHLQDLSRQLRLAVELHAAASAQQT